MHESQEERSLPEKLVVAGQSDDLVQVYGDVRVEASKALEKDFHIVFNDGTILRMFYSDRSCWNIDVVAEGDGSVRHSRIGDYTGDEPVSTHSEVVTVEANQHWMAIDGELVDFTTPPNGSDTYEPTPDSPTPN
jgi:hypothetical protein